ncbi:11 TM domain-containing transmembrane protein [Acrasis kona]|uniref:11 TM domain-containing transmembrane protein n=1 Tax=Acrasis kona TaxID=1008807 RepID=A0AAW2ZD23_9EUKA
MIKSKVLLIARALEQEKQVIATNGMFEVIYNLTIFDQEKMASDGALGGGGILFTLILNIIIATIIFVLLGLSCLRITPFVVKKKRRLFGQFLEREDIYQAENKAIQEEENRDNYFAELENYKNLPTQSKLKWYFATRFLFNWEILKSLFWPTANKRDADRSVAVYGRDIASYFFFQRLVIYSFMVMTFIGLAVLLPLHITGTLPESYQQSDANAGLTYTGIEMIQTSPIRTIATLILAFVFLLTITGFCIIYFCLHPLVRNFNYKNCDQVTTSLPGVESFVPLQTLRDELVLKRESFGFINKPPVMWSPYALEIRGLPRNFISQNAFDAMVEECMARNRIEESNVIIHSALIMDMTKRLQYEKQRKDLKDSLDQIEFAHSFNPEKTPMKRIPSKKFKKVDAIEWHNDQIKRIESKIRNYDSQLHTLMNQCGRYKTAPVQLQNGETQPDPIAASPGSEFTQVTINDTNQNTQEITNERIYKFQSSGFGYVVFNSLESLQVFQRNYRKFGLNLKDAISNQKSILQPDSLTNAPSKFNPIAMSNNVMDFVSLSVNTTTYEPDDVNYDNLYTLTSMSRAVPLFRKILAGVLITILIIFFSTPAAFANTIQSLLEGGVFPGVDIRNISVLTTGTLGALVFQYLPTLLLVIASILIPFLIKFLTKFEKNYSRGEEERLIMKRIYVYLIMSTLVLPILVQASMSGLVAGFVSGGVDYALVFGNIFLPFGGAFFVNYVLQKAIISTMISLVMIGVVIKFLLLDTITKHINPAKRLNIAEPGDLNLEMSYANIVAMMGIGIVLCVLTPVVIPACLLFFVLQYFVERFNTSMIYGQRKQVYALNGEPYVGSAAFGIRNDYTRHRRLVQTVVELVLANMIIFTVFLTLFFAARIALDNRFIAHTIVCAVFGLFCIAGAVLARILPFAFLNTNRRLDAMNLYKPDQQVVGHGYAPPPPHPLEMKERLGHSGSLARIGVSRVN